ncbi:MAG: magnesium or manganese-dependent protein [Frankiales bacterium]|nr:magnesium or manganese-dependent protein [Frankiales bacterium]
MKARHSAPAPLPPDAASRLATLLHVGEATSPFFGDLDYDRTLASIVEAVVPAFADHAFVDVAADIEDGAAAPEQLRRAALRHSPIINDVAVPSVPVGAVAPYLPGHPTAMTFRTGESFLQQSMNADAIRAGVPVEQVADAYERLGLRAGMTVALHVGGRVLGVLTLAQSVSGRNFDPTDLRVAQHFAHRAAVAIDNAMAHRATTSLASTLQRILLPGELEPVPGVESASRYLPAGPGHEIGGDLIDVFLLAAGLAGFVIADVQGRGLGAAALMGQLRVVLRSHALDGLAPPEVLERGNRLVSALADTRLVTCLYGVIDVERQEIAVANAGHLPLLCVPSEGQAWYTDLPSGLPLGTPGFAPGVVTIPFSPGTSVLGFTDGLVEDRSRSLTAGLEMMRAAQLPSEPDALCAAALLASGRDASHDDDIALLALRLA